MNKHILTLTLAVTFLVACNVQASIISVFYADSRDSYFERAGASQWAFAGVDQSYNASAPWQFNFSLVNLFTEERVDGGNVHMNTWNGNGNGYVGQNLSVSDGVGITIGHNSANWAQVSFNTNEVQLSSFFIDQATHSNGFDRLDITVTATDGWKEWEESVSIMKGVGSSWFGFIFDEGVFLREITYVIHGTNNTGFGNSLIGFGDGTAVVPAPATLAVVALGLAGLGYVRARRKK